jgi:hypothetical protein
MSDLEPELRAVGRAVEWPATPDLAATVAARLDAEGEQPRRWWHPVARLRPAVAVPAMVAVVVAATAAVPPARSAILRLLGIEAGERIVRIERPPVAPRRAPAFGERMSLEEARRRVPFPVLVPVALGPPADVRYSPRVPGGEVSLVYGARHVLTAFEGATIPYAEKLLGPHTALRHVDVAGAGGIFIAGGAFRYVALDRRGRVVEGSARLVDANVLLWERGRVAYRLETRAGLRGALRIARSLR